MCYIYKPVTNRKLHLNIAMGTLSIELYLLDS